MHITKKGFSLYEMLVILFILIILGTLGATLLIQTREDVKITKTENDLALLKSGIDLMRLDTREWPGHQMPNTVCTHLPGGCPAHNEICNDGCDFNLSAEQSGLIENDSANPYNNWNGPYVGLIPKDPWGHEYFFDTDYDIDTPNNEWRAVLGSYGPNGQGNDLYDGDDIILIMAF